MGACSQVDAMPTVCKHSQATDDRYLQPADLWSFSELPESHDWTPDPTNSTSPTADGIPTAFHYPVQVQPDPVPVIDLNAPTVSAQVAHAGQNWGIFYITGHGVPQSLLAAAEAECRRLFELPAETKLRAARLPGEVPGYGVVRIARFFDKHMWAEGFTVFGPGSPEEHAKELWPNNDGHQCFCDVVKEYRETMRKVAARVTGMLLDSLGLSDDNPDHVTARALLQAPDAASALQMNSYPPCPDPDRALGLAEHTDSSLVTLLHQSYTCTGFQLLRRSGDGSEEEEPLCWVPVAPVPGALMVNVGDLFQIMSNGYYQSPLHRAVVSRTEHRVSLAYLYGPPAWTKFKPVKGSLNGKGERDLYPPIAWSEYLKIKERHFHNALHVLSGQLQEAESPD